MNWDQTGSNYVPENNCTVDFEGVKKIALPHNDDKRQMTFFLFGFTKVGLFIHPNSNTRDNLIRVTLVYPFEKDSDFPHKESYWSTSIFMKKISSSFLIKENLSNTTPVCVFSFPVLSHIEFLSNFTTYLCFITVKSDMLSIQTQNSFPRACQRKIPFLEHVGFDMYHCM